VKRFLRVAVRVVAFAVGGLLLLIVLGVASVYLFFPRNEPASDMVIEATPERLARGSYLFENVSACHNCHSEREWRYYAGPVVDAKKGAGKYVDMFGRLHAHSANITPYGVGDYSDGELIRAITAGVKKDGSPVHPLMSFDTYAKMPREDVYALVAYLRTLPVVEKPQPANELAFPFNIISRVLPKPWNPPPPMDRTDTVAYGAYLAELGDCGICHGFGYGGGRSFAVPSGGTIRAANISPDPATGIGSWTRENFIGVFKSFAAPESQRLELPPAQVGTVMPWTQYAGMTEEDLGAIYDFLRSKPPVENLVDNGPRFHTPKIESSSGDSP